MILQSLTGVGTDQFVDHTGWMPKPEGLCQGELCVPAPGSLRADDTVDVQIAAQRLGMPLVHDEQHGLWALGSATMGGRALASAAAADPELRTHDARPFRLSSLRGRKVVLVAWASY
jgi:hypothetical protein